MNYGDHNFIEITQQTKLRVALVVSRLSSCAVRQCRHSQNAWARLDTSNVSSRVVSSRAKWNLGFTVSDSRQLNMTSTSCLHSAELPESLTYAILDAVSNDSSSVAGHCWIRVLFRDW